MVQKLSFNYYCFVLAIAILFLKIFANCCSILLHRTGEVKNGAAHCGEVLCSKGQCRIVWCRKVKYSAVQCNSVRFITVPFSSVQFGAVQCRALRCGTVRPSELQETLPHTANVD